MGMLEFARLSPCPIAPQVKQQPRLDKNGELRSWLTLRSRTGQRIDRKQILSDEEFRRIASAEQAWHEPMNRFVLCRAN